MRRFISTSFIALALLISAAGAAPAAHAAIGDSCSDLNSTAVGTCQASCSGGNTTLDSGGSCGDKVSCCSATAVDYTKIDTSTPEYKAAANTPTPPPPAMDMTGGFGSVMIWIMSLFAWLLGVAALTLNYAVYYTVVTMGSYIHDIAAIGVTWRILRDIGNIIFIFGFLGIGISVILNVDWYGGKTKMLPMLLIGAIFLNFSLFITEAVIDVGNLFATQFYTQIIGGTLPTQASLAATTVGTFGSGNLGNEGISNKLMGQLGLQTIYNEGRVNQTLYKNGNTWTIGFMGIILFITAAFVMFSLAFILITRFVYLIFLIILAPIGFAGLAIPKMKATADWWWHSLFQQTITAPILLLLLYIALAVITDVKFLSLGGTTAGGQLSWTGFVEGSNLGGFAGLVLTFLVAMGLLLYCVIAAKQLSAFGAAGATKLAGKLSFGATAWAGRAAIGTGIGRGLLGNRFIKRGAVSDNKAIRYGSRLLSFTGKRLQNRTFDARNMPGAKTGLGLLGVDAGTPSALTAKELQGKQYGYKPVKEFFRQSGIEHEQAAEELKRKAALAGNDPDEITRALAKMTTKEIEELGGIKNGVEKLVSNLSPQQFEALMKSDKLSEVEKNRIKTTRYKPLENAVASRNAASIKKAVSELSKGELETIPTSILTNTDLLNVLSDKQRETLTDSRERTAAEKTAVRSSSPSGLVETIFDASGAATTVNSPEFKRLTAPQIAKMKNAILTDPAIAETFNAATLRKIQDENKLSQTEMVTIGNAIRNSATANQKNKDYVTNGPGAAMWS